MDQKHVKVFWDHTQHTRSTSIHTLPKIPLKLPNNYPFSRNLTTPPKEQISNFRNLLIRTYDGPPRPWQRYKATFTPSLTQPPLRSPLRRVISLISLFFHAHIYLTNIYVSRD